MKTVRELVEKVFAAPPDAQIPNERAEADALDAELARLRELDAAKGTLALILEKIATARAEGRNEGLEEAAKHPVDMLLYCPKCGLQHVDEPSEGWANPPHRSHLCHGCGTIWRPADMATNGVEEISTRGSADTWCLTECVTDWNAALEAAIKLFAGVGRDGDIIAAAIRALKTPAAGGADV